MFKEVLVEKMIIGITGLAGSGKDSAARIIMKKYPSYKKLSFASRLIFPYQTTS